MSKDKFLQTQRLGDDRWSGFVFDRRLGQHRPPYVSYAMLQPAHRSLCRSCGNASDRYWLGVHEPGHLRDAAPLFAKVGWHRGSVGDWCARRVSQCSWGYSPGSERQQPMVGFVSPRHGDPISGAGDVWLVNLRRRLLPRWNGLPVLALWFPAAMLLSMGLTPWGITLQIFAVLWVLTCVMFAGLGYLLLANSAPKDIGCGCLNNNWIMRHVPNSAWRSPLPTHNREGN